jgi:hypothetical protein
MSSIYSWNVQGASFFFFGKDRRERTLETTPSDYPLHSFIYHSHSRCDTHRLCLYSFSSPAFVWALLVWRYPRSLLPLGIPAGMEAPILQRTSLGMGTMSSNMPLRAFHPCLVDTLADHPTALQLLILPLLPSPRQTKSFSLNSSPPLTNTCVYHTITLLDLALIQLTTQGVQAALTIGGWTGSQGFSSAVATASSRTKFVNAVLGLVSKYDLDGVDFE